MWIKCLGWTGRDNTVIYAEVSKIWALVGAAEYIPSIELSEIWAACQSPHLRLIQEVVYCSDPAVSQLNINHASYLG